MTVIRAARSAEGRYTQITNAALQDYRLSFRARGLMAYLLSLPPSARVNSSQLADRAPEGRDAIRKALAELERYGYLKRTNERTSKGTFRPESVVCDDPSLLEGEPPAPENPAPENPPETSPPGPENPTSDNQAPKDKDGKSKETPSESAADGGDVKDDPKRINQLAGYITKYVMERYPFNNGQAIAGIARAGLRAGTDSHLLMQGILAAAESGGPITINAVKHHIKLLTGGYERQPRTVDEPGTKVHDNGLEVLW